MQEEGRDSLIELSLLSRTITTTLWASEIFQRANLFDNSSHNCTTAKKYLFPVESLRLRRNE